MEIKNFEVKTTKLNMIHFPDYNEKKFILLKINSNVDMLLPRENKNDKNISDIQLTKGEYVIMDTKSKTDEYCGRRRITDPEVIKFAREFERNPFTPTGRDIMYNFYKRIGMDVEYDEIFTD